MDDSEPLLIVLYRKNLIVQIQSPPDTDFSPWLLVSQWRGSSRGRGGSSRANHVTLGDVAILGPDAIKSRGTSFHNIRVGKRFAPSGRQPPSHVSSLAAEQSPIPVGQSHPSPPVIYPLSNEATSFPRNSTSN